MTGSDWSGVAPLALLVIVLAADGLFGGVPGIRSLLGLPLKCIRHLTRWFDSRLNRENRGVGARRIRGLVVVIIIVGCAWALAAALEYLSHQFSHGWVIEAVCILALIRQRDCLDRMRRVSRSVGTGDYEIARTAVAPLVRYDTASLDEFSVSRAAIEAGAAGVAGMLIGSVFWYLLLGLPGLFLYRANSAIADVIGRPSPRHAAFGFVAARLDDVLSLLPAFLAGPLVILSALFVPKASPAAAMSGWARDLMNRGFQTGYRAEGGLAGALGVALGGPRSFDGASVPGKWIGDGRARATANDIDRAVFIVAVSCLLACLGLAMGVIGQAR